MFFDWHHTVLESETDWLGHASNVAFVDWVQKAAIAASSDVGWTPERYVAYGSAFMVHSHRITYLGQANPGDQLRVRTWVEDMNSAKSLRRYTMERLGEKPRVIARAETIWAFVDLKRGLPRRIPEEIYSCFAIRTKLADAQPPPAGFSLAEW